MHEGVIVAVATFGAARFLKHKKEAIELLRFAILKNYSVVGGFSKILSAYKKLYPSQKLITYADRRYSTGTVYSTTGFKLIRKTSVGYFYTDKNIRYNRQQFQKHLLKDKLTEYNPEKTEAQNMFANGYRRIWDCGNLLFELQ